MNGFHDALNEFASNLDSLEQFVRDGRRRLEVLFREAGGAEPEKVSAFMRKPWCILPAGSAKYWLVVPVWSDLCAGWLHHSTDSYRVFQVDRYTPLFSSIPEVLQAELELPDPVEAKVDSDVLRTDRDTAEKVKRHLGRAVDPGKAWKIKPGHEFELLADLVKLGALPFSPRPVEEADLRPWRFAGAPANLRDYQKRDWLEFLAHGSVGIFWPMSAGKTVIGTYAIGRLRGRKLVIADGATLVDQWTNRIAEWAGEEALAECDIVTYQGYKKALKRVAENGPYMLKIPDECHTLPADTFSRFVTVPSKYTIGLSATPHREDGRENYLIAFVGKPLGSDWSEFFRKGLIRAPDVHVRVFSTRERKIKAACDEARASPGRRLIFCDSLDLGRSLAKKLQCPFVHGDTKNRLEVLAANQLAVISRVGDQGLSLPDLRLVVEVDFHGGSRRQEGQRSGRLFHADRPGRHVVLMTAQEHSKFGRRLLALEEKGIFVKVSDET